MRVDVREHRGRPLAGARDHARQRVQARAIVARRLQQRRQARLALALDDTIDRAGGVLQDLGGGERGAVSAHDDERVRQ